MKEWVKKFNHFIWCLILILFITISLLMVVYDEFLTEKLAVINSLIIWFLCILILVKSTVLGIFSPVTVYLLLLGVFHLGLVVPNAIGIEINFEMSWIFSQYLPKAIALCAVAFSSYTFGVILSTKKTYHHGKWQNSKYEKRNVSSIKSELKILFYGGILIGFIGLIMLFMGVSTLELFTMDYGESFAIRMTRDPRLFGVGYLFTLIGMVITGVGSSRNQIRWVCIVSIAFLLPIYFYGFRGHVTVYLISFLLIWNLKESYVGRRVAILGLVAVVLLSPAIKMVRSSTDLSLIEGIKNTNPISFFLEAGGSIKPLIETINEIEYYNSGYWYGKSYAIAAFRIIPNLWPEWEKGKIDYVTPSAWITRRVDPWIYARGGGLGYSAIAEPYLNFGLIGVIGFFIAIGYFLERYEHAIINRPKSLAIFISFCAALFWTTRNDFTEFLRPAIWSWIYISTICFLGQRLLYKRQDFSLYSSFEADSKITKEHTTKISLKNSISTHNIKNRFY